MSLNRNWIPVYLKRNGLPHRDFASIQECFRFLSTWSELKDCRKNQIYDIINAGLDDDTPYGEYTFHTTYEHVQARANRKTRRKNLITDDFSHS
ncbi:hypothetical protein [Paenibacillus lignilyticus]|uniref:Uncharacterized protein n=1 Tax=Paenibacillus lignilyticus TaxID=1172615 RepID=A0ABS5CK59_9BACL|nr:hypothetical protein [Paenibacillus lignilyticus]MBP3966244.1 hypothetical protein [Paenibacillus lignilyticus]